MSDLKITTETHEAVKQQLPPHPDQDRIDARGTDKQSDDSFRRKDIPPPSIWQQCIVVVNKATAQTGIVAGIDLNTRQFRAYYPDTDTWDSRLEWHPFDDWNPQVQFTAAELERQHAAAAVSAEFEAMDAKDLGIVSVLADGDDPRKVLGKIQALRAAGMISTKKATKS